MKDYLIVYGHMYDVEVLVIKKPKLIAMNW